MSKNQNDNCNLETGFCEIANLWLNFVDDDMFTSLAVIFLITFGGTILTYLYEKEDSLLPRIAAGNVIGSAIFGTAAFVFASLAGFSVATVVAAIVVSLLPLLLLTRKNIYTEFVANLRKARGKFEGATLPKFLTFLYYSLILLVLCLFFDRAMFETNDGIFTGASQNLGDLPFHLGAIYSFTEGNNFPPLNPSYDGAKFTYPFVVDLIAACFVKLGAMTAAAMFVQNVTLTFSLVVLLERFTAGLSGSRLAGRIAPILLLLSGGLGFFLFFRDYFADGRSFFEFLRNLPMDYTIRPEGLRWGNTLIVLFVTQRGFLLGMPIVLLVLHVFRKQFFSTKNLDHKTGFASALAVGLLAGTLPLIHVHSLFVLFVVAAFTVVYLFVDRIRHANPDEGESISTDDTQSFFVSPLGQILIFGAAVCIVAVPELIWSLTGSATNLSKFIGWHFGWDKRDENFLLFWIKNLGLFLPLTFLSVYAVRRFAGSKDEYVKLLKFYAPFLFIFILGNTVKLAPWEWDNIKILIYWFVASVPFVAWLIAKMSESGLTYRLLAAVSVLLLTLSGSLDIWRVVSHQINYKVFSSDAVQIAEEIKRKTPPNALFLNAPTYNSAVVLSGRRSLMRYSGHLSSYGIDYEPRENEVKRIYEGSGLAAGLLKKNAIEYVLISPEETSNLRVDPAYFERFTKIAEAGAYRVYKVN